MNSLFITSTDGTKYAVEQLLRRIMEGTRPCRLQFGDAIDDCWHVELLYDNRWIDVAIAKDRDGFSVRGESDDEIDAILTLHRASRINPQHLFDESGAFHLLLSKPTSVGDVRQRIGKTPFEVD